MMTGMDTTQATVDEFLAPVRRLFGMGAAELDDLKAEYRSLQARLCVTSELQFGSFGQAQADRLRELDAILYPKGRS